MSGIREPLGISSVSELSVWAQISLNISRFIFDRSLIYVMSVAKPLSSVIALLNIRESTLKRKLIGVKSVIQDSLCFKPGPQSKNLQWRTPL